MEPLRFGISGLTEPFEQALHVPLNGGLLPFFPSRFFPSFYGNFSFGQTGIELFLGALMLFLGAYDQALFPLVVGALARSPHHRAPYPLDQSVVHTISYIKMPKNRKFCSLASAYLSISL